LCRRVRRGGWERLGDIADATANQPLRALRVCGTERRDPPPDLREKVTCAELEIVIVEKAMNPWL
jgi:hypothetical protein